VDIGIAFDLADDFAAQDRAELPEDAFDEYDSESTVVAIEAALASRGHRVVRLGGGKRFLAGILARPPDIVFNIAEGRGSRSREAHVPAVCEIVDVPCTHSDPLTMAMTLDKAVAKRIVASAGIPTPAFAVVEYEADLAQVDMRYPLFVKPLYEGSSMGIDARSRVLDPAALEERVQSILRDYHQPVLVEEFCSGAELTVGILGNCRWPRVAATMEVVPLQVPSEEFVYSNDVKHNWEEQVEYHAPPRRPSEQVQRAEAVAVAAYTALGCRDVARIDVRFDASGTPQFIECNPLPGLAPGYGDIALAWEKTGHRYEDLVLEILDQACKRVGLA